MRQAWFSTFRGWAEGDARAAARELAKYAGLQNRTGRILDPAVDGLSSREEYLSWIMRDDRWKQQSFQAVFAEFAKSDPDAAWEALPELEMAGLRDSALEGIFRGVEGEENLRRMLALWEPQWNMSDESSLIEIVKPQKGEPRLQNEFARANRSTIGVRAALALAEYDQAEAVHWLRNTGFDEANGRLIREHGFYFLQAARNPASGVELLQAGLDMPSLVLSSLVRWHSGQTAEYLALVHDPGVRAGSMEMAIHGQSRLDLEDLFPAPGRSNRLPDHERRYHDLLEALAEGTFEPASERSLRTQLHREFAEVLPEAAEALKAIPTKAP